MAASVVSAVADAIATSAVVHVFALHAVIKNDLCPTWYAPCLPLIA